MKRHQMIKKIEAISDLPTLPVVAMSVNRMLQDEKTPIDDLITLLEKDQSMVLKLLRLVNSSFYGFKSKISNLRHAITLLGYGMVQNAVVTLSVIDCLDTNKVPKGFDVSQFWTHSIAVAVMGRHLANQTQLAPPEDAFTAGLVHDIGKVVLATHFPEEFIGLLNTAMQDAAPFYATETQSDTYPHTLIGDRLAKRWMLPESLALAIRYHHGGSVQADPNLPGLVTVADTLINVMHKTPGHRLGLDRLPVAVRAPLIDIFKESDRWFPQVETDVAAACDFFNKG
jgi:putative nucleotidyltransferase with HDIG domain